MLFKFPTILFVWFLSLHEKHPQSYLQFIILSNFRGAVQNRTAVCETNGWLVALAWHIGEADGFSVRCHAGDVVSGDGIPLLGGFREIGGFISGERSGPRLARDDAEYAVLAADGDLIQRRGAVVRNDVKLADVAERGAVGFREHILGAIGGADGVEGLALFIRSRERDGLVVGVLVGDRVLVSLLVVGHVLCAHHGQRRGNRGFT